MDTQIKNSIINEYINGEKLTVLFKKYHTSYKTVSKILDEAGIDHSRSAQKKGVPQPKNMRILTPDEEKLVCQIYQEKKRIVDCEKAINGGQDVVRRCLQKYGLYRTQSEAIRSNPQNQRKYFVKDDYFDEENERMAYILGFLAADGCIRKDTNEIKLSLSSVDKTFLEELQVEIGGSPVSDYITNKGFAVSTWRLTSKHIKDQLRKYGIVPQKTFTFSFPKHLEKKYWRDFIRGYFDGDGSVSTAGASAIRFQVCSATPSTLETMVDFFEEQGIPRVSILCDKNSRKHPLYYFQYSSISTRKIYEILYYENCLCLSRKREKYEQLLSRNLKK